MTFRDQRWGFLALAVVGIGLMACDPLLPPESAFSENTGQRGGNPDGSLADAGASDSGPSTDAGPRDGGPLDGGTGNGLIGSGCTTNSDCQSGDCLAQVPGGYCSQVCGNGVSCPGNSQCTQVIGGEMLCLRDCSKPSQCRTGYTCQPTEGVCNLPCENDMECATGQHCDTGTGQCLGACQSYANCASGETCNTATHQCTGGPGQLGGPCSKSSECVEGNSPSCLTSSSGFPDGYCVSTCGVTSVTCPGSGECVAGLDANGGRLCVTTCATAADCRYDYQCVPIPGRASVCMPPCTNDNVCGPGQTCDTTSGVCQGGGEVGGLNGVDGGG